MCRKQRHFYDDVALYSTLVLPKAVPKQGMQIRAQEMSRTTDKTNRAKRIQNESLVK